MSNDLISEKYLLENGWVDVKQTGLTQMPYFYKQGYDCGLIIYNSHNVGDWSLNAVKSIDSFSDQDFFERKGFAHIATFHFKRSLEDFEALTIAYEKD